MTLVKPIPVTTSHWVWRDCENYVKQKFNTRPGFWHFVLKHCDIFNGATFYLPVDVECEPWEKEILGYFNTEFGDEFPYYVSR